jgi:hypothetical protein
MFVRTNGYLSMNLLEFISVQIKNYASISFLILEKKSAKQREFVSLLGHEFFVKTRVI